MSLFSKTLDIGYTFMLDGTGKGKEVELITSGGGDTRTVLFNLFNRTNSLLFIVGRFVYHPLLPLSKNKDDPPVYADFSMIERAPGAIHVRDSMVRLVEM